MSSGLGRLMKSCHLTRSSSFDRSVLTVRTICISDAHVTSDICVANNESNAAAHNRVGRPALSLVCGRYPSTWPIHKYWLEEEKPEMIQTSKAPRFYSHRSPRKCLHRILSYDDIHKFDHLEGRAGR